MQKARRHLSADRLRPLVSVWFQVLFHSSSEVLFTFPSRYWFTIGLSVVFSLTGWSRQIHTEFLEFRATQDTFRINIFTRTGLSPSMVKLSKMVPLQIFSSCQGPTTPILPKQHRFGLFPFRSPLLRESLLFSVPPVT